MRQQSLSERFLVFPAALFERVLKALLPTLVERWNERQQHPSPPAVQVVREHFSAIRIVDGSTLEALFRKLKALEDVPIGQLAGKMCAVIDLATHYPVDIRYRRRWRIEDAFNILKRVLNPGYLWTGSVSGIKLQLWATWLFYAILLDLGDAVADALKVPMERILLEMLFRDIYHFSQAYAKGLASDLVAYFASPQNQDLGVVKTIRKPILRLDISPYPT